MTAPAVTPAQVAADLRAAATWVRRNWCAGAMYHPRTGAVCMVGAIAAGIYGRPPTSGRTDPTFASNVMSPEQRARWAAAEDVLNDYLARHDMLDGRVQPPVVEATDWNDVFCQSGERAGEVLEAAAAEIDAAREVCRVDAR
jgi:hypothetical protein